METNRVPISRLRKLYADCTTLASQLAHSSNGGRREPLTGQFAAIRAYTFRQCAAGRDINGQTMCEWRREFVAQTVQS